MKQAQASRIGFVAALLLGASGSCSSESDTPAPISPDGGQEAKVGTVASDCKAEIDSCSWAALECSSQAECAPWYSCLLDCAPINGLQGCFNQCTPSTPSAAASELQSCLAKATNGTCNPTVPPDSGVKDTTPPTEGGFDSCEECLSSACEAELKSCTQSGDAPDCLDYKHIVVECASKDQGLAMESCLLNAEKESSAIHQSFATAGVMTCLLGKCSDNCVPADSRACVSCSQSNCSDQYGAWSRNAIAQDLAWCRHQCKGDSDCLTGCKSQYDAGTEILSALIACQSGTCSSCPQ